MKHRQPLNHGALDTIDMATRPLPVYDALVPAGADLPTVQLPIVRNAPTPRHALPIRSLSTRVRDEITLLATAVAMGVFFGIVLGLAW